jgi:hypothetical protein
MLNKTLFVCLAALPLGMPAVAHAEPGTPDPMSPPTETVEPGVVSPFDASTGEAEPALPDVPAVEVDPIAAGAEADTDAAPAPTSSPAPASTIVPAPTTQPADVPPRSEADAVEAFSARRGFRMVTAGTSLAAAGVAWAGVSGWMLANDDPRAALGLAFAIDGAVALSVGMGLMVAGARRVHGKAAWLDRRPGRRSRLAAAAEDFEFHAPQNAAEAAMVAKGHKLRNLGFFSLTAGVGLVAFGTGMQVAYPSDNIGVRVAVPLLSVPFVIAGAALLSAGGKRIHAPHRFAAPKTARVKMRRRIEIVTAPSFHRGGMSLSLTGRF